MSAVYREDAVLAIYPCSRGFGFVLFEGPESPFDWGVKILKEPHRNEKTLDEIKLLIDRYRPEALVIEDLDERGARRSARIRKLNRMITHLARIEFVELYRFPQSAVHTYFASVGATTKYEIAKAISTQIPAFAHRMPRFRKAWMSQDSRQALFDAAALGLVFYASRGAVAPQQTAMV